MNIKSVSMIVLLTLVFFCGISFCGISNSQESEKNMNEEAIEKIIIPYYGMLVKTLDQIHFPKKYFDDYILEKIDEEGNTFYGSIDYKNLTYLSKKNNRRINIKVVLYATPELAIVRLNFAIMARNRIYDGPNFNIGDYIISADDGIFIFSRANVIVDIYADPGLSMLSAGEEIDGKILEIIKQQNTP